MEEDNNIKNYSDYENEALTMCKLPSSSSVEKEQNPIQSKKSEISSEKRIEDLKKRQKKL